MAAPWLVGGASPRMGARGHQRLETVFTPREQDTTTISVSGTSSASSASEASDSQSEDEELPQRPAPSLEPRPGHGEGECRSPTVWGRVTPSSSSSTASQLRPRTAAELPELPALTRTLSELPEMGQLHVGAYDFRSLSKSLLGGLRAPTPSASSTVPKRSYTESDLPTLGMRSANKFAKPDEKHGGKLLKSTTYASVDVRLGTRDPKQATKYSSNDAPQRGSRGALGTGDLEQRLAAASGDLTPVSSSRAAAAVPLAQERSNSRALSARPLREREEPCAPRPDRTASRRGLTSTPSLLEDAGDGAFAKGCTRPVDAGSDELEYRPHVSFLNVLSSQTVTVEVYVNAIVSEVTSMLLAERCGVFFVDDVREEAWCMRSGEKESFSIPWDAGPVGLAAREGKITTADGLRDEAMEQRLGVVVKSLICLPIRHVLDLSRTIGVLEVVNKLGGRSASFSQGDAKVLLNIARLVSDSFYRHRWKALESCGSHGDAEALSLIHHTGSSMFRKSVAPVKAEDGEVADRVHEKLELVSVPPEFRVAGVTQLRSLNFNALECTPDELTSLVEPVMQHTGCIERCRVPLEKLRNWAQAARKLYRDNAFHNWYHGFSVFQICYHQLLVSAGLKSLTSLETFGLLVAALCHDLDHPGFTNAFMIDSQSQLALRHNDIAVLENHHANLACELLRRDATAIGCGMDQAGQKGLRRIVIRCILDTDMAHHGEMCKRLQEAGGAEGKGLEDRQLMLGACIHSADLSGQVLPWRVAQQWEERISLEFVSQAREEIAAGRTPMPFMNFKVEDVKQRGKLQRDFLDFVLVPLWDPFTQLVPELRPCYRNLIKNRAFYNHRWMTGQDPSPEQTRSRRVAF